MTIPYLTSTLKKPKFASARLHCSSAEDYSLSYEKSFTMRFLILVFLLGLSAPWLLACGPGSNPPPPPARIVSVGGADFNNCSSPLVQVLQVEVDRTDLLTVTIQGGTLSPISLPLIGICGGVSITPAAGPSSSLVYNAANNDCAFVVSFRVTFNSTGSNRRVTLAATRPGAAGQTRVLDFQPPPTISTPFFGTANPGSSITVCEDEILFTGGGFFSSSGPAGATVQWTASSFGGPPLTFGNAFASSTTISGFQANASYGISVSYTCPSGGGPVTSTIFIDVLPNTDPACQIFFRRDPAEASPNSVVEVPAVPVGEEENANLDRFSGKALGINGAKQSSMAELSLYPNPLRSGERLNIRFDERFQANDEAILVVVRDATGRVLSRQTMSSHASDQIQTDNLPPGWYVVTLQQSQETVTKSFVVNGNMP